MHAKPTVQPKMQPRLLGKLPSPFAQFFQRVDRWMYHRIQSLLEIVEEHDGLTRRAQRRPARLAKIGREQSFVEHSERSRIRSSRAGWPSRPLGHGTDGYAGHRSGQIGQFAFAIVALPTGRSREWTAHRLYQF